MSLRSGRIVWMSAGLCLLVALAGQLGAVVEPNRSDAIREKELRHADLYIPNAYQRSDRLPAAERAAAAQDLAALGVGAEQAFMDRRSGLWGTLISSRPMLPGRGNSLTWETPPASPRALDRAAWDAFVGYLGAHRGQLKIDPAELVGGDRVTVNGDGTLVQIHARRTVDGITVRDSYLTAVLRHGNMVLFSANGWGAVRTSSRPTISRDEATAGVLGHVAPLEVDGYWRRPSLAYVPMVRGADPAQVALGQGYQYRLAWVVHPRIQGDGGSWEALLDAHTGELLSFADTNHYVASTRKVSGGVFPVTNDGIGPEGTEQAGWPMPFADLTTAQCGNGVCEPNAGEDCLSCSSDCNGTQGGKPSGRYCCGDGAGENPVDCGDSRCGGATACNNDAFVGVTDSGGNLLACVDGTVTTNLASQFMLMNDNCGAIDESSAGDVDLGTSGGTDCTVPAGHSAGDTHSSRSGFYEMNRIKEQARAQLPNNTWLQGQLQANMNINLTCNAFWTSASGTVNFYRFGDGCGNTGEIAAVFDHEWGHGMDNNDANPSISSPGEGIADIFAAQRLNTSCIGRGFFLGDACSGFGDPCIGSPACDGVRDIDWMNRQSGQPHDITSPLPTGLDALCGSGGSTPCGGSTHCEGAAYGEAFWDLLTRDLPCLGIGWEDVAGSVGGGRCVGGASPTIDSNTALEIATRLSYLGSALVGNWFQCTGPFAGCNGDSGYLNFLAADDDDGNTSNGTPHMTAIFDAFNRHGIACDSPTVTDSGCAGGPTSAPSVTTTASDRGVELSWSAVTGASKYQIYRTDGIAAFACDFGKTKVGETAGTAFTDGGLQNGRPYSYVVIPIGPDDACLGPASSCATATPVAGPNFPVDSGSVSLAIAGGDGDAFLDNCETGQWTFDVNNIGAGTQNNVRIVSVTPSNPGITVDTVLPSTFAASLAECATAAGTIDFTAGGLSFDEVVTFDVEVTSDELSPAVKSATFTVSLAESDFQNTASKTFTFEVDEEGWTVVEGTFNRTSAGGGAQGTSWYEASSASLPDQCDHIQSPVIGLTASSTLSLWNQFDIEGAFQGQTWYDRANLGLLEVAGGGRNAVDPDGGRLYNASGANGNCGTTGQNGWADAAASWAESTWSSSALGGAAIAGDPVRLDIRYGTDPLAHGTGFHFDQVTLTDIDEQVADTQSDSCVPAFCGNDVIESPEVCDGLDLNNLDCGDFGCDPAGTLACQGDCTAFDLTGCNTGAEVCNDGVDNDCNGDTDCADATCTSDPVCVCVPSGQGQPCTSTTNCCSGVGNCTGGKPSNRVCV